MTTVTIENIHQQIFEITYPIGTIFVTTSDQSPDTLIKGGENSFWTKITDRFLLASGSKTVKSTGGSSSHNHTLSSRGGANIRFPSGHGMLGQLSTNGDMNVWDEVNQTFWYQCTADVSWEFTSKDDTNTSAGSRQGVGLYGNTDNYSTLPPYYVVNIWERVS